LPENQAFLDRLDKTRLTIRDEYLTYVDNGLIPPGNLTVTHANPIIDELIADGIPELEAITLVSSGLTPTYPTTFQENAYKPLADSASFKGADTYLLCNYGVCRHNRSISQEILQSRGYDVNVGVFKFDSMATGEQMGGHQLSVVFDAATGNPVYIDPTNNVTVYGSADLNEIWNAAGLNINYNSSVNLSTNQEVDLLNR
jgi:hypothetical protein